MPVKLFLVRHGEPRFPDGIPVYMGNTLDYPLSDRGREQAERAAEALRGETVDRIYASPLKRAMETAAPIAARFPVGITELKELEELATGELTGRSVEKVRAEFGPRFRDGSCFLTMGGESDEEGLIRVRRALKVIKAGSGNAVIVAHRGILRLMLTEMAGDSCREGQQFDLMYAEPKLVTLTEDGRFILSPACYRN